MISRRGRASGTWRIVFLDSENSPPSAELVETVQTAVDPETNHGEGLGIAPIGHTVTVAGAEAVPIHVSFALTLEAGLTWEAVADSVREALAAYFAALTGEWENAEKTVVRLSQVESRILDVAGVVDIAQTTLNGGGANLVLSAEQAPVLGEVNVNEAV